MPQGRRQHAGALHACYTSYNSTAQLATSLLRQIYSSNAVLLPHMLRRVAVGLVLLLQLLFLFFPLLQRFARWAGQRGDAQLHALAVRAQVC